MNTCNEVNVHAANCQANQSFPSMQITVQKYCTSYSHRGRLVPRPLVDNSKGLGTRLYHRSSEENKSCSYRSPDYVHSKTTIVLDTCRNSYYSATSPAYHFSRFSQKIDLKYAPNNYLLTSSELNKSHKTTASQTLRQSSVAVRPHHAQRLV